MVEIAYITDRRTLKRFLEGQSQGASEWVAARAALRNFPETLSPVYISENLLRAYIRSELIIFVYLFAPSEAIRTHASYLKLGSVTGSCHHAVRAIAEKGVTGTAKAASGAVQMSLEEFETKLEPESFWLRARQDLTYFVGKGSTSGAVGSLRDPVEWPPLWYDQPNPLEEEWDEIRTRLEGDPLWAFWLDWYQRLLDGGPFSPDYLNLLETIALKDNAFWQRDETHVNGEIAGVWEDYKKSFITDQAAALLGAALSDFSFDQIHSVMKMVPFQSDIEFIKDAQALQKFLSDADELIFKVEAFCDALGDGRGYNIGSSIRSYFNRVLTELSKANQMGELNVGRIVYCGRALESYGEDDEASAVLGQTNYKLLLEHVSELRKLTFAHFAKTFARLTPLEDMVSSPATDQWELLQDLQRGIAGLENRNTDEHIPLDDDGRAVFQEMVAGIEALLHRYNVVTDPNAKSALRKDIDYRLAQATVSVLLYWEQRHKIGNAMDVVVKWTKRVSGLEELIDKLPLGK